MHPDAVHGDGLQDLATQDFAAGGRKVGIFLHDPLQHPVLQLVVAMGRHGQAGPGVGQGGFQFTELLARIPVQHGQDRAGGHQAVVVAVAQVSGHEEVARLLEPRQGAQFGGLALDVGVARLPVDHLGAIGLEDLVGLVEAGRLHIDHEGAVRIDLGQVAGQHQADLVGKDLLARVVNHPAAITVAVEAQGQVGAGLAHPLGHLHQHGVIFRVRIVLGEGVVEVGVHLDHLDAHPTQGVRGEGAGGAVAAGADHLQRPLDLHLGGDVGHIGLAEVPDTDQFPARPGHALAVQHDVFQPGHFLGPEGQGLVRPHLDPGPAVLVVAGGDHGHAGGVQFELTEIGHGRQGQADVQNLHPAFQKAQDQGLFDAEAVAAEIMAGDDPGRDADFVDIGGQGQAERLNAEEIDLLLQDPARVVFPKPGRLDQGLSLIGGRVRLQVLAGLEHGASV